MLNLADAVDQVWNILRAMERHIQGTDREQLRAGQFHEDIMENIRDAHRVIHGLQEAIEEGEVMGCQHHWVNLTLERMGNQLVQLTQRIISAEARAEAVEARETAAEATAVEALGLVNAVALGNLEEIVEESEPEEEPEEDPEEGPEEDDTASTVSSAHSAHP